MTGMVSLRVPVDDTGSYVIRQVTPRRAGVVPEVLPGRMPSGHVPAGKSCNADAGTCIPRPGRRDGSSGRAGIPGTGTSSPRSPEFPLAEQPDHLPERLHVAHG